MIHLSSTLRRTAASASALAMLFTATMASAQEAETSFQADGGGASYLAEDTALELRTITANDVRLSVAVGGNEDAPALLLTHGFLGNAYSWTKMIDLLDENYELVVPDMRGYGGSEITDGGYDGQTLANDFAAVMEQLGHSRYHVMAHDMSAPATLLLAAEHPERVLTLTYLEEPAMLPDNIADKVELTREDTHLGGLWWWMMAHSPSMTETLILDNELDFVSWFYDNYSAVDGAVTNRARQIFAADLAGPRDIHGWFGVYRDLFDTMDQTAALETDKVATPILAVGGENSQGLEIAENLRRIASDVEGHSLEGAAHFLMDEKPEELVDRFNDFVRANGRD